MLKIIVLRNLVLKTIEIDDNEIVKGGERADEIVMDSFKSQKLKNEKSKVQTYIKTIEQTTFLTLSAKEAFNYLK